jgi:hypothetical protein
VKIYKWLFIILTLAQLVFTVAWYLFTRRLDHIVVVSCIVYLGTMAIGYLSYEVEKYRRKKKHLLDNLP